MQASRPSGMKNVTTGRESKNVFAGKTQLTSESEKSPVISKQSMLTFLCLAAEMQTETNPRPPSEASTESLLVHDVLYICQGKIWI